MAHFAGARILIFRVGDVRCAVEASSVREIMSETPATRLPGAPPDVMGVINVRGSLVTLVDARRSLGLPPATGGSVILLDVGDRTVGLWVDEVEDMISVSQEGLAERETLPGVHAEYVRAVGRHGAYSYALLDTGALMNPILPS